MSPLTEHILALLEQIKRDQNEIPDRIVVSPVMWDALRLAHADDVKYDAYLDPPTLVGLRIQRSPLLASGFVLFKGDKLLKAVR